MAFFRDEGLLNFNQPLEDDLILARRRLNLENARARRQRRVEGLLGDDVEGAFLIDSEADATVAATRAEFDQDRADRWKATGQVVTTGLGPFNRQYDANEFTGIQPPPMAAPVRQAPSRMSGPTPGDHHPPIMKTGGFKWPGMKIGAEALTEMSAMIAAAEPPPVQPAPIFKTGMGTRPFRAWNAQPPSAALAPTGVRQLRTPISSPAIDSTASARNKKLEELLYGRS